MRRLAAWTAGMVLMLAPAGVWASEPAKEGCHGTSVQFVASPSEAAKQAEKEEKLVFVLHVSGHFEDPGVT